MRRGDGVAILLAVAALSGCGDDDRRSPAPQVSREGAVVAALGDSITAGMPGWDPDPVIRSTYGDSIDRRSQYGYWLERERPDLAVRNCGVSGERTYEISRRLARCAKGATYLVVQGGLNDIAQGRSVDDVADDLREMVIAGKARGLRVAVAELLPWNNGKPEAKRLIAELNARIARLAREERVTRLRFHDALEDPRAPGRMPRELTAEGDHPSVAGYRRMGAVAARQLPR